MVGTGQLVSLIIVISIASIIFYELGASVLTSANTYNTSAAVAYDSTAGTYNATATSTAGTMGILFGGTIFVVLSAVAIFKKAGLF